MEFLTRMARVLEKLRDSGRLTPPLDPIAADLMDAFDAGAALPAEPMVVNPQSGVEVPMRQAWAWACARIEELEARVPAEHAPPEPFEVQRIKGMLAEHSVEWLYSQGRIRLALGGGAIVVAPNLTKRVPLVRDTLPAEHAPPAPKLSEIRARLEAATGGPFWFRPNGDNEEDGYIVEQRPCNDPPETEVALTHNINDAALLAHAPDDIRYLLELVGSRPALAGSPDTQLWMAEQSLVRAVEELNRPQAEWRWDELRLVECALAELRAYRAAGNQERKS